MESTQAALIALGVGVIIGALVVALVVMAMRARELHEKTSSTELPSATHAVLHGMDDLAVVVDTSLLVVAASPPAEIFGMRENEVLTGDDLRSLVREARRTPHPETKTLTLRRGMEERLVAVRATVITPRLTLVVLRDITERERVEQMRRDFVANTSHELKTPVGAVTLLAEAIESAADDPERVRDFAGRLIVEASRLSQLTARIMSLSRVQSADDFASLSDVAIDEVVALAIESQAMAATSAGIEIVRGGVRGAYVRGDAQVLTEAIGNLVANAIAYSPSGASVGIGVTERDGVVEIAVSDRGIGIPEAEQQRVFERFYRADQARSRRTGGTGLGLSIVKHAVQRHGGEIELWSRPGKGSTFTVRIPAIEPPPEAIAAAAGKASTKVKTKAKAKKRKRALVKAVNGGPSAPVEGENA
ncbi:sensor histidine kinase [Microbacterium sp. No. 7]|uniref:sensor histidine kinase n=1 Tax=Microbacterium sp. No. 7 TaxID=1714373 RepID=UPI0006CF8100|nr:ATP-binding protein [Microbacterium sp. No. 7]ALJ19633.1 histidine kinase [Microbacterium sp. No. 7]